MKKFLSALLTFILIFVLAVPAFASQDSEHPTIYITGAQTNDLLDAEGNTIYPQPEVDAGAIIKEALVPCFKELAVGLLTDDYQKYAEEFHSAFMQIYGGLALDENGEASDGSRPRHTIYNVDIPKKNSNYQEWDYRFWYDWRISPITVAEELKIYIDMVKEATGESKVNLMGRCYGANVIQAYITLYPEHAVESIDDIAYLASSVDGIDMLGAIFAGDLELESQAITNFVNYFMEDGQVIQDEVTYAFTLALVEFLNTTTLLGITGDSLELLVERLQSDLIPMILKDYFGSMPAYWAMVPAEKYLKARSFVFAGCEDTYAGLIEKNNRYYYEVQLKVKETLLALDEAGIDFYIFSKYNFPDYPIYEGATALSDGNTTVYRQSFGATCADYNEVLSDKYISSLDDTKYLSPDLKIDASTCLFPETSYFIKDLHHEPFPPSFSTLAMRMMNEDVTVSGGQYAQYLLYIGWDNPMVPVEGIDEDGTKDEAPRFLTFIRFFTALFNFITKLLKGDFDFGFNLDL